MSSITTDNKAFLNELTRLVGHSHLLTEPAKTARYRKGFRSGGAMRLPSCSRVAFRTVARFERLRRRG